VEFAGAEITGGRITMCWPEGQRAHKEAGRRESSIRRLQEGLRPFVREFADRPLDSFTRDEALTWGLAKGANVQQAVRQFFNHALDRGRITQNHFTRMGASKRKRRVERPDFEIITPEQYQRLREGARNSRPDAYGLIIEGAILAVGETAMRPGEIFALHRPDIHLEKNLIHVKRQIDLDTGKITWPKDDDGRVGSSRPSPRSPPNDAAHRQDHQPAHGRDPPHAAATCAAAAGPPTGKPPAQPQGCPAKTSTS
jgi:integrase